MKLAIFLLSVALFQARANTYAQKVTLSGKEITLKQVFAAIEKQTDYVIFSNESFLTKAHKVSLTVHQVDVEELLNLVLKDQPIQYSIKNKTIILSEKKAVLNTPISALLQPEQPPLMINGLIRGQGAEPLSGVSVRVKGSSNGTSTDVKGSFSLKTDAENLVLQFSMIGYEDAELSIKKTDNNYQVANVKGKINYSADTKTAGQVNMVMYLNKSVSQLDEMQVTAYGKTSRRLATSNIGTVKGEDIENLPVTTVLEAMIGRIPGVTIQQHSGNGAAPIRVEIRGKKNLNPNTPSDPLYVIDGVPLIFLNASPTSANVGYSMGAAQGGVVNTLGENPLLSINPRDIERIDVLQDADGTAIYGSRGANGVILITTKKPKAGPMAFSLTINNGIKFNQKIPKTISTQEYLAVRREAFRNDGIDPVDINAMDLKVWDTTKYTNWMDKLSGVGNVLTINAGLSGGTAQTSYRIAANYGSTQELLNNGGKNNLGGFLISLNHSSMNQKFRIGMTAGLSLTDIKSYGLGRVFTTLAPNTPDIYTETGEFNFAPFRTSTNSRFPFSAFKRPSISNTSSVSTSMDMSYVIMKGLTLRLSGGYNFGYNQNDNMSPQSASDPIFAGGSVATFGNTVNKGWQVEPQLEYITHLGRGTLSVQVLGTASNNSTFARTLNGSGFANEALMKSVMNAETRVMAENFMHSRYISGSGIIKYDWDNRYVLSLNGRRDGSSKFGPGRQFGNFGSVGLAWLVSNEKWMKKILPSWFSFLKLFGNTGVTGFAGIGDYEYMSRWGAGYTLTSTITLWKYNGMNAFHAQRALNQDYQWENFRSVDLTLNMGFLKERLTVNVNTYRSRSHNKLAGVPTPLYSGFLTVVGNTRAVVENKGILIDLGASVLQKKDWSLSARFNIGLEKNKLADYPNLELSPDKSRLKVGASMQSQYLLRYTGIDPLTGNFTFLDYNKDGVISMDNSDIPLTHTDDRFVLVDLLPTYTGGAGVDLRYKNFSLSADFYFVNRMVANPIYESMPGALGHFLLPDEIKNSHWQKPGDIVKYPRFTTAPGTLGQINKSDAYYMRVKYLRMTGLSIGYSLPAKFIKKAGIKGAQFGVNTSNIFTVSNYRGYDPDITSAVSRTPIPRTITLSLGLNF